MRENTITNYYFNFQVTRLHNEAHGTTEKELEEYLEKARQSATEPDSDSDSELSDTEDENIFEDLPETEDQPDEDPPVEIEDQPDEDPPVEIEDLPLFLSDDEEEQPRQLEGSEATALEGSEATALADQPGTTLAAGAQEGISVPTGKFYDSISVSYEQEQCKFKNFNS